MTDATTLRLFAVYNTTTRRIEGFTRSNADQSLDGHPDLSAREIDSQPAPSSAGYMFDVEWNIVSWAPDWTEKVRAKLVAAQSFYDGLFALPNGFTFGGKLYQMDDESRSNWVLLGVGADRSASDSTAFPWTDIQVVAADNSVVSMDLSTARQFTQATMGYWAACRPVFRAIKDAIAVAADQAALDAIDVTAGYPPASN